MYINSLLFIDATSNKQEDLNDTLSHTGEIRSNLSLTFEKVKRSQLIQLT